MIAVAKPLERLASELSKLPGIGPKSAMRLAYHLLYSPQEQSTALAEAILSMKERIKFCPVCFNFADGDSCPICQDERRDPSTICVVESPSDIVPLERMGRYKGLYHVLHGTIKPTQGVGPDELRISELMSRLQEGKVTEVIMATNPNVEGETTAMYLCRLITPLGIRVSRLARGLPFGADLEYADDVTIGQAFEGRQDL